MTHPDHLLTELILAEASHEQLLSAANNLGAALTDVIVERNRLLKLVAELIDPDPCEYDHHGYCQAHSLQERPCPHERGRAVIAKPKEV